MKDFVITYNDLSEQKKDEIYNSVSRLVKDELIKTMPRSEWLEITFGEFDKLVNEKIKECKFKFVI